MANYLGIDIGTSGCKVLLVNEVGVVIGSALKEYPLETPQPGWTQQSPEEWWRAVLGCLDQLDLNDVAGIGLSGQMHGMVALDANGAVIRPAILWNDQRTVQECDQIEAKVGKDRVIAITGNPMLTGFQLGKVIWLQNHEPDHFARIAKILLPKDYIRYRLSGEFATDVSDASGTGALDLHSRDWSKEILQAMGLPTEWWPKVYESHEITSSARHPQLEGVPIIAGGGDQAASGVGTGAVTPGILSVSLGTSGVIFSALNQPKFDAEGRVHTFCHSNKGWHAMSVMLNCGGAVKWFRDRICPDWDYAKLDAVATAVEPGSKGAIFLPYLSGERAPINSPHARGQFAGLSLSTGREELARSVMEGVCFGLRNGYECLSNLIDPATELRVSSGGAKSGFWRQLLAVCLRAPVTRLKVDEGPAYGAALLAAVGTGQFKSTAEGAAAWVKTESPIEPTALNLDEFYSNYLKAQALELERSTLSAT